MSEIATIDGIAARSVFRSTLSYVDDCEFKMPNTFYLLSTAPLTVDNLDGFATCFLKHDAGSSTFRYCLLLCTNDGTHPLNAQLGSLLVDLHLAQIDATRPPASFLKDSLNRSDEQAEKEVWQFFEFGAGSPLDPFDDSEIKIKVDDTTQASVLLITPSAGLIQRPTALNLANGDVRRKIRTEFSAFGQFYGRHEDNGQFEFQMDGTLKTTLNLPFALDKVFSPFKSGLGEAMQLELQHEGPGSYIRFNDVNAVPTGNQLSLTSTANRSFKYADHTLTYFDSIGSETKGFLTEWRSDQLLKGTKTRLTITASEMKTFPEPEGAASSFELQLGATPPLMLSNVDLHITENALSFNPNPASLEIRWNDSQPAVKAENVQLRVDGNGLRIFRIDGQTPSFTVPWDFTRAA